MPANVWKLLLQRDEAVKSEFAKRTEKKSVTFGHAKIACMANESSEMHSTIFLRICLTGYYERSITNQIYLYFTLLQNWSFPVTKLQVKFLEHDSTLTSISNCLWLWHKYSIAIYYVLTESKYHTEYVLGIVIFFSHDTIDSELIIISTPSSEYRLLCVTHFDKFVPCYVDSYTFNSLELRRLNFTARNPVISRGSSVFLKKEIPICDNRYDVLHPASRNTQLRSFRWRLLTKRCIYTHILYIY